MVAAEVKALAAQTARATEEVSSHIQCIRASTGAAVGAIGRMPRGEPLAILRSKR